MFNKILESKHSLLSLNFSILSITLLIISFPPNNVLSWDVFGYYLYIPSFFIYNDLGIDNLVWVNEIVEIYNNTDTLYQFSQSPIGHNVIQYPMGMAILFLPFFFLGHLTAILIGGPIDGFSQYYQIAFIIGNIFYMVIGLIYLRKVLIKFYSDKITALVLLIITIGTNYLHLNVWNIGMSHNYLFALYALLIWLTIKWHKEKNIINSIKLGIIIGLIILIRPSEIVCILIPFFYGFKNFSERKELIISNYRRILVMAVIIFLVGLPQLLYWKIFGGNFFYVSYRNNGEGLDFLSPHVLDVLFSFRKGWFIYTPVMIFSMIGIYYLHKQNNKLFIPVLLFFIFNLFIVSSWSVWWYATSFSQRALMQSYAVMAIPLGSCLSQIAISKRVIKWGGSVLIIFFVVLNIFQIWQMNNGIIDGSRMTKPYYCSVFGQLSTPTAEQNKLLLIERSTTAEESFKNIDKYVLTQSKTIDFEGDKGNFSGNSHSGNKAFKMSKLSEFSPAITSSFKSLTDKDHAWVQVSMWVYPLDDWKESNLSLITAFQHGGKNYKYRGLDMEKLDNIIPNQWNKMEMEYLTPEVRSVNDNLIVYAWLRGEQEIIIDDIKIKCYAKRD